MIWREKKTLLIILGALLLANAIFFFTYRVQYENRLRALDARMDQVNGQLQDAKRARIAAKRQIEEYRKIQRDVDDIYTNRWATQGERLLTMIADVKRMAAASNLTPPTYSFTQTQAKRNSPMDKTGATEVAVSFSVSGTYQQIRQLINRIELSNQFVIINQVGLSSDAGERLSMTIQLKTLFREAGDGRRTPAREL